MNTKSYRSRSSRYRRKEFALTWGGLGIDSFSMSQEVSRGHSTWSYERGMLKPYPRRLTTEEGLNIESRLNSHRNRKIAYA